MCPRSWSTTCAAVLGPISQRVYGEPTRALSTVGITGTNGKTTVSYLLESVLVRAGLAPALLGTVALRGPAGEEPAQLTTPEADAIARFAHRQRQAGARSLVMEVSSHALEQGRVLGMHFEVAAFTNLTQDHLDFHGDHGGLRRMPSAGSSRSTSPKTQRDHGRPALRPRSWPTAPRSTGQRVLRVQPIRRARRRDFRVRAVRIAAQRHPGARGHAPGRARAGEPAVRRPQPRESAGRARLGPRAWASISQLAAEALATAAGAPGRLERVEHPGDVLVFVDYAHTPDALERALARAASADRAAACSWSVGCGGDRDRSKRAPMGEAAARECRSGDPHQRQSAHRRSQRHPGRDGAGRAACQAALERERVGRRRERLHAWWSTGRQAIRLALAAAKPGDSVLLAGKGHETYQIVGKTKHDFDDRARSSARHRRSTGRG